MLQKQSALKQISKISTVELNVTYLHVIYTFFLIGCSFSSHPLQTRPSALSKSLTSHPPPLLFFARFFLFSDLPCCGEMAATNHSFSCPTKQSLKKKKIPANLWPVYTLLIRHICTLLPPIFRQESSNVHWSSCWIQIAPQSSTPHFNPSPHLVSITKISYNTSLPASVFPALCPSCPVTFALCSDQ